MPLRSTDSTDDPNAPSPAGPPTDGQVDASTAEARDAAEGRQGAEDGLDVALEAAEMGVWQLDVTRDTAVRRSPRHDQLFGYATPQPVWGQEIAKRHVLEEDRAAFDAAFARARETGALAFEVRVRWPDGSVRWMACRGRFLFDEKGNPVRGAGVNFDVTARRVAEAALRASEARYRALVDNVRDYAIYGLGADGVVTIALDVVYPPWRQLERYGLTEGDPPCGFRVIPRRWVVERSLAWLGRNRRLNKDYERLRATEEALVYLASIRLLLRRLAKRITRPVALAA